MKKEQTFRTFWTFPSSEYKGEVVRGKSLTVPNQSMSIPEILARSLTGASLVGSSPEWTVNDDEDIDNVDFPVIEDLSDYQVVSEYYTKSRKSNTSKKSSQSVEASASTQPGGATASAEVIEDDEGALATH